MPIDQSSSQSIYNAFLTTILTNDEVTQLPIARLVGIYAYNKSLLHAVLEGQTDWETKGRVFDIIITRVESELGGDALKDLLLRQSATCYHLLTSATGRNTILHKLAKYHASMQDSNPNTPLDKIYIESIAGSCLTIAPELGTLQNARNAIVGNYFSNTQLPPPRPRNPSPPPIAQSSSIAATSDRAATLPAFNPEYDYHTTPIKGAISYLFSNYAEVRRDVGLIAEQLLQNVNEDNDYTPLGQVFHDPCIIRALGNIGATTYGNVREYILDYIDKEITKAFSEAGQPVPAEWNKELIQQTLLARPDHNALLTFLPFSKEEWYRDLQILATEAAEMRIGRMLTTTNGQKLINQYRLNDYKAIQLGADKIELLITPSGQQMLEGENPRLTLEQAKRLHIDKLTIMKENPATSFQNIYGLQGHQVAGYKLGLSYNAVSHRNFTARALSLIQNARNSEGNEFVLENAYARFVTTPQSIVGGVTNRGTTAPSQIIERA